MIIPEKFWRWLLSEGYYHCTYHQYDDDGTHCEDHLDPQHRSIRTRSASSSSRSLRLLSSCCQQERSCFTSLLLITTTNTTTGHGWFAVRVYPCDREIKSIVWKCRWCGFVPARDRFSDFNTTAAMQQSAEVKIDSFERPPPSGVDGEKTITNKLPGNSFAYYSQSRGVLRIWPTRSIKKSTDCNTISISFPTSSRTSVG